MQLGPVRYFITSNTVFFSCNSADIKERSSLTQPKILNERSGLLVYGSILHVVFCLAMRFCVLIITLVWHLMGCLIWRLWRLCLWYLTLWLIVRLINFLIVWNGWLIRCLHCWRWIIGHLCRVWIRLRSWIEILWRLILLRPILFVLVVTVWLILLAPSILIRALCIVWILVGSVVDWWAGVNCAHMLLDMSDSFY